jgi:hypothetical protein
MKKGETGRQALVAGRHARDRRIDVGEGRLQQTHAAGDCPIAQALRRPQPPPQIEFLPFGHVDADVLYQSRGKGLSATQKKKLEKAKDELRDFTARLEKTV